MNGIEYACDQCGSEWTRSMPGGRCPDCQNPLTRVEAGDENARSDAANEAFSDSWDERVATISRLHAFCPSCGTEAEPGTSYCGSCGKSLAKSISQNRESKTSEREESGVPPSQSSSGENPTARSSKKAASPQIAAATRNKTKTLGAKVQPVFLVIGGILIVSSFSHLDYQTGQNPFTSGFFFLFLGLALAIGFPVLRWAWKVGGALGDEMRVASRGVPSPQHISAELEREWGRAPTVEEVAAVHTMLTNRQNQALINTGIGFGALYLMKKHSR